MSLKPIQKKYSSYIFFDDEVRKKGDAIPWNHQSGLQKQNRHIQVHPDSHPKTLLTCCFKGWGVPIITLRPPLPRSLSLSLSISLSLSLCCYDDYVLQTDDKLPRKRSWNMTWSGGEEREAAAESDDDADANEDDADDDAGDDADDDADDDDDDG
jgi:hypothetical protein